MPVVPPKPRHILEDQADTLKFTIPSQKNWFLLLFHGLWVCVGTLVVIIGGVFAVGFIAVLSSRSTGGLSDSLVWGPGLFILIWLGSMAVLVIWGLSIFLWQLVGKEIIEVRNQSLTIQRRILKLSIPKEYLAEHINSLRVSPHIRDAFGQYRRMNILSNTASGPITFDYGAQTVHCASEVDEPEARQIIAAVQQRFPNYRKEG